MAISIANRILLGFVAVIIAVALLCGAMLLEFGNVRDLSATTTSRDLVILRQIDHIDNMQSDIWQRQQAALIVALSAHQQGQAPAAGAAVEDWRPQAAIVETQAQQLATTVDRYAASAVTGERADGWRKLDQILAQWTSEMHQFRTAGDAEYQALSTNDLERALSARRETETHHVALGQLLDQLDAATNNLVAVGSQRVAESYEAVRSYIAIFLIAVIAISLLVTFLIRRAILGPLRDFTHFVERIGRGDLTGNARTDGPGEFNVLGVHLNEMLAGLRELTRQSRQATENLNAAVTEIRASTQEQSAGVEEQLAAIHETAATVDQITHAGGQINSRAKEVMSTAQITAKSSQAGSQAVEETSRAMDAIREQAEAVAANIVSLSEKTQAIGDITITVNDLSERSHLLALNAAIEAASAGESGRRFAVVAAEMKSLADQAKEATAQVRSILGDIQRGITSSVMLTEEAVKRVASGKDKTDTTLRLINDMVAAIQESIHTFQQIVASTNQQQLGVEQVTIALQNIRQAGQQTASGVRQLDSAAINLSALSQQLLGLAERYQM